MTNTTTKYGLTYINSSRMGECGFKNKEIYFPLFLIGGIGEDQAVISWNGEREIIKAPRKMNYKWFEKIAQKIKDNPNWDYDWFAFSNNILKPNKEHIKTELNLTDEKVEILLADGGVFLNNFFRSWADDGEDENEVLKAINNGDIGHYPNFMNFMKYDNLEY